LAYFAKCYVDGDEKQRLKDKTFVEIKLDTYGTHIVSIEATHATCVASDRHTILVSPTPDA